MPSKPKKWKELKSLLSVADQKMAETNERYDQYRTTLETREENMGYPGPNSGEETYTIHPPDSPIGGGDAVTSRIRNVFLDFPRVDFVTEEPSTALAACAELKERILEEMPMEGHPVEGEATRMLVELETRERLIRHCQLRWPRILPGRVRFRGSGEELLWDNDTSQLLLSGVPCLVSASPERGGWLGCLSPVHGGKEDDRKTVIDLDGSVDPEALAMTIRWARGIMGRDSLGSGKEWHDGTEMERHTYFAAAAEWTDLTRWIGTDPVVSAIFRHSGPDRESWTSKTKVKLRPVAVETEHD
eukprot:Hpha_TRINITY_DN2071_c0_g1::TRINITY_DN2071_c0_g1_i1::g.83088::m.83088